MYRLTDFSVHMPM